MRTTLAATFQAITLIALSACAPTAQTSPAPKLAPAEPGIPPHVHIEDVIYGRKYGMSLTLDVFQPPQQNGAAIVALDSGGWMSDHDHIWAGNYVHYLERGYTVFHVVHGSAPKFSVPEEISDVRRAVKFIRFHAADYHIDPNRLGITGDSAGGLLSLMMGVTDTADPQATDPVERVSSRVQAVACFCPPIDLTDVSWPLRPGPGDAPVSAFTFLDFMERPRSRVMMSKGLAPGVSPRMVPLVTAPEKAREILRASSPIAQVSASSAPVMIVHGEKDQSVPVEGSKRFMARLTELGVPGKLVIVPGAGHSLPDTQARTVELADWFDTYLKPRAAPAR